MKKFLGILGGLALIGALFASPVQSQTVKPILSNTCTLSAAGQPCLLNGMGAQSTCVVTLTGTWSGTVSFFILDPQQLTTQAIKGWAPDGSGTGGTTTTSNVTGWSFPCAAQASFETVFTTASSGSVVVQEWATTGVGYRAPNGAGGGTLTGITAGTNIVVNPSGAPSPTVAVTAAPVFSGAIVGNAAATPSPAPSGYNGVAVIAQATSLPTAQPGNADATSFRTASFTNTATTCTTLMAFCGNVYIVGTASVSARFASNTTLGTIEATVPFASTAHGITCSATADLPCVFTWTCTMSSGACTTTQSVPASSTCTLTPNVTPKLSTTNLVSYWATIASTALTIQVTDELGSGSTAFSGTGNCL